MKYIPSIGLEVHVQLTTRTKMFCGCSVDTSSPPNTHVCPVCLGYPGAMPVMNTEAIRLCVKTGLMLGCEISAYSKFDRKNYFYPDMPKNFQISQYDKPLCLGGGVDILLADGTRRCIRVNRIHQEEDVAKNMHFESSSGIDFNRAGTPLMELVTEPDLHSPEEAMAFLSALKEILLYGGISACNLEEGNMRCDVNISVRPETHENLGTKVEIKNMNTFKGVVRASGYEIQRQIELLEHGGAVVQETRRWDDVAGVTSSMRSKEYAHDYRYFPEPDLMPVVLSSEQLDAWRAELPELPATRRARLVKQYGLPEYDAEVLTADQALAAFFEDTARASGNPKAASNWIMGEMLRLMAERSLPLNDACVTPMALGALIKLVDGRIVNMTAAKEVFAVLFEKGGDPVDIVKAKGLAQVSDTAALEQMVDQAMSAHPSVVADYRGGKTNALQFLVGQVMKASKGKANPGVVAQILKQKIG